MSRERKVAGGARRGRGSRRGAAVAGQPAPRTTARPCRTPKSRESTTTTEPVDLTQVSLEPIAARGQADLDHPARSAGGRRPSSGKVIDADGNPVPGAFVRATYYGDPNKPEVIEALSLEDGTYRFDQVLGGRWRIRAWKAPELATLDDNAFFLGYTEQRQLDLKVKAATDIVVTSSMAPNPPFTGSPVELAVLVLSQSVDEEGVVHRSPVGGAAVTLDIRGKWSLVGDPTQATEYNGRTAWSSPARSRVRSRSSPSSAGGSGRSTSRRVTTRWRRRPRRCSADDPPAGGDDELDEAEAEGVVVDELDPSAVVRHDVDPAAGRRGSIGNATTNRVPPSGVGPTSTRPPMAVDQLPDDGQAEPGADLAAGLATGGVEPLEDPGQVLGVDAGPVVGHGDLELPRARPGWSPPPWWRRTSGRSPPGWPPPGRGARGRPRPRPDRRHLRGHPHAPGPTTSCSPASRAAGSSARAACRATSATSTGPRWRENSRASSRASSSRSATSRSSRRASASMIRAARRRDSVVVGRPLGHRLGVAPDRGERGAQVVGDAHQEGPFEAAMAARARRPSCRSPGRRRRARRRRRSRGARPGRRGRRRRWPGRSAPWPAAAG